MANNSIKIFNSATQKWDNTTILNDKTIIDNTVAVVNSIDNTKKLIFDASGITTGTTRTQKIANQNGTIVATNITGRIYGSLPKFNTDANEYQDILPVWSDLIGKLETRGNAQAPVLSNYFGNNTWFEYNANGGGNDNTYMYFSYHLNHDYVPNTDIFFHVHYSVNQPNLTGNIHFICQAFYGKSGQALNSMTANFTITQAVQGRYVHTVSETQLSNAGGTGGLLNTADLETDSLILVIVRVQNNNVNHTLSNKSALFIHQADIHYLSIIGSKNKAAPFNG